MGDEPRKKTNLGEGLSAAQFEGDALWDPKWTERSGEATIRKHLAEHPRKFYCSWFCPFAQRVWITLEESGLPYQYVEVNPYLVDPNQAGGYSKKALRLIDKKKLMPDFVQVSPRGLVPAIRDDNGSAVWESTVSVEYLSEKYESQVSLMPTDPAQRALVRILVEHCNNRIQKSYYTWLMAQDNELQDAARATFVDECRALAAAMAPNGANYYDIDDHHHPNDDTKMDTQAMRAVGKQLLRQDGPFVLGQHFSAVDVALAPFWQRIHWVGGHYRGIDLTAMATTDPAIRRLEVWWKAVSERSSVKATLVCRERLLASYSDYAKNIAKSDFANSMRSELKK